MSDFAHRVIAWQRISGRHDLPWQGTHDPYRIWLSEVMLQQTQVGTVIDYFNRFVARFPDVARLAQAPLEPVLELWSGLGYYSRARNLHAAARQVMACHGGQFPTDPDALMRLPGVGRSTAAAIAVFSVGAQAAIMDGNVKRVFCRHDALDGHPSQPAVLARLWTLAEARLPQADLREYTQGLMDLGATLCTRSRPGCDLCPLSDSCRARELDLASAYPPARARREIPVRELIPVVILRADHVLLERRPDKGIWGGLWSLPECLPDQVDVADVRHFAAEVLGAAGAPGESVGRPLELARFNHALTHFRLVIAPWLVESMPRDLPAPEGAGARYRWLALADAATAALPQPIKRLLQALARSVPELR